MKRSHNVPFNVNEVRPVFLTQMIILLDVFASPMIVILVLNMSSFRMLTSLKAFWNAYSCWRAAAVKIDAAIMVTIMSIAELITVFTSRMPFLDQIAHCRSLSLDWH